MLLPSPYRRPAIPSRARRSPPKLRGAVAPPYRKFGNRPLYRWADALDWARGRLSKTVTSSSELEAGVTIMAQKRERAAPRQRTALTQNTRSHHSLEITDTAPETFRQGAPAIWIAPTLRPAAGHCRRGGAARRHRGCPVTAAPLTPEPSLFVEVAEAARLAGMSESNIRRRCMRDGLGFKPGGRGEWIIRRADLTRWLAGEVLK